MALISPMTWSSVPAMSWCILAGSSPFDEIGRVAVAAHQGVQLLVADAGQHRGVGDLVAVQVQDGQHRSRRGPG